MDTEVHLQCGGLTNRFEGISGDNCRRSGSESPQAAAMVNFKFDSSNEELVFETRSNGGSNVTREVDHREV